MCVRHVRAFLARRVQLPVSGPAARAPSACTSSCRTLPATLSPPCCCRPRRKAPPLIVCQQGGSDRRFDLPFLQSAIVPERKAPELEGGLSCARVTRLVQRGRYGSAVAPAFLLMGFSISGETAAARPLFPHHQWRRSPACPQRRRWCPACNIHTRDGASSTRLYTSEFAMRCSCVSRGLLPSCRGFLCRVPARSRLTQTQSRIDFRASGAQPGTGMIERACQKVILVSPQCAWRGVHKAIRDDVSNHTPLRGSSRARLPPRL